MEQPHVQHGKTGHRWLDFAVPIAALFVSFVSIFIAWHHGQVMKQLVYQNERIVEAESLPYVQLSGSNADRHITLNAINEGVGPAKIVTAEVFVDGHAVQSADQLIDACCKKDSYLGIQTSSLQGRMVRPGDTVAYLDFHPGVDQRQALAFDGARQSNRIKTRLCYCSVFNDCWIAKSNDPTPDAVKQCAAPAVPYRE